MRPLSPRNSSRVAVVSGSTSADTTRRSPFGESPLGNSSHPGRRALLARASSLLREAAAGLSAHARVPNSLQPYEHALLAVMSQQQQAPPHAALQITRPRNPVPEQLHTPPEPATPPPPPARRTAPALHPSFMSKTVCQLSCRFCVQTICARGMKAILLADTRVELYS
ncbi:Protein fam72a, partial [Entophlyctis sp. JEL0112]